MKTFDDIVIKLNKEAPSLHFSLTNLLTNKEALLLKKKGINSFQLICEEQLSMLNKVVFLTQILLMKSRTAKPQTREILNRINELYPLMIAYAHILRQQTRAIAEDNAQEFRRLLNSEKNLIAPSQSLGATMLFVQGICKLYPLVARSHYEFIPIQIPKNLKILELLKLLEKCQFKKK